MSWLLTLTSKLTGKKIPGVAKAPGGKIKKPKEEVEEHLANFLSIVAVMLEQHDPELDAGHAVLYEMYLDLYNMAKN